MDEERNFLSVTIPAHPHFTETETKSSKEREYENGIIEFLSKDAMSKNQLAKQMGYKGITSKLSKTVDKMLVENKLEQVVIGSQVKFRVNDNA